MNVSEELFLCMTHPNGMNTYTLTTRLGQMLVEAEMLYGERDHSFTILGVEFYEKGPYIWLLAGTRQVLIRLSSSCLMEPQRAYYQLANEIVHLLNPVKGMANNLEEGVATEFAHLVLHKHFGYYNWTNWFKPGNYDDARKAANIVTAIKPDFVREMRKLKPLSEATEKDILGVCPTCPVPTAQFLAQKF